ncbi:MAG TPA: hypothetical protein VGO25_01755 [Rhodanobacteraceae bacterium]|jgi:hypothetical protein|nr:hypothetical protein [Rhodanobacteraceae bacterium]
MEPKAWIAAASAPVVRVCAFVIAAGTAVFAWRATISVVVADAWTFAATFLARYYDGTLVLADFFAKRETLDHSQPVQKVLLLINAQFFDLDFAFEAMFGIVFGLVFVALIAAIIAADVRRQPRARKTADLALLGTTAIVFSLNELGVFNWSLVTLSLFYPVGVTLMLVLAFHCIEQERASLLGVIVLAACVALDTSAILCSAAVLLLIALRSLSSRRARVPLRVPGAVVAAVIAYLVGYAMVFPAEHAQIPMHERMSDLIAHAGDAWQALVVPFGAAVTSPNRISETYGVGATWAFLFVSAIAAWCGNAWFWREFMRRRDERLPFVAAGLMLFFYATTAGIVWARVPRFGFEYLMQPRYAVFYELQLIAILMLLASTAARREVRSLPALAFSVGVAAAAVAALWFLYSSRLNVPSEVEFNRRLADSIVDLANDPAHVPRDCPIHHLTICAWPPPLRTEVLGLLQREHLNVFSATFRARHALPPLPLQIQPAPVGGRID